MIRNGVKNLALIILCLFFGIHLDHSRPGPLHTIYCTLFDCGVTGKLKP
jgi:hypothetical protein